MASSSRFVMHPVEPSNFYSFRGPGGRIQGPVLTPINANQWHTFASYEHGVPLPSSPPTQNQDSVLDAQLVFTTGNLNPTPAENRAEYAENCAETCPQSMESDTPSSVESLRKCKALVAEIHRLRPYAAPYGKSKSAWGEVLLALQSKHNLYMDMKDPLPGLRRDLRALIAFKEDLTEEGVSELLGENLARKGRTRRGGKSNAEPVQSIDESTGDNLNTINEVLPNRARKSRESTSGGGRTGQAGRTGRPKKYGFTH